MHIGFGTVNLKGEHFTSHVSKGDEVKAGDLLCEFDIEVIKAVDYPVTTPVVVSNSKKTGPVLPAYAMGGRSPSAMRFLPWTQNQNPLRLVPRHPRPKPQRVKRTTLSVSPSVSF